MQRRVCLHLICNIMFSGLQSYVRSMEKSALSQRVPEGGRRTGVRCSKPKDLFPAKLVRLLQGKV